MRHAWGPLTYSTKEEALGLMMPSLDMPSDHAPILIDLQLPMRQRPDSPRWQALRAFEDKERLVRSLVDPQQARMAATPSRRLKAAMP